MTSKDKDKQLFDYIKANHQKKSARTIGKELGISATTVRRKAKSIGIEFQHNATLKIISSELDRDIEENFYKEASIEIAKRHGLSEKKVNSRAAELGLEAKLKAGRNGKKQEALQFIALNYNKMTNQSMADELNISISSVNRLLAEFKLHAPDV
jgi:DNA-binding CsgD family transcriptional regulator